eukprot:GHUV01037396.1.p1 GENE.GHUV01037396.1~~GHUV01037396.1.p1  ORF type:complete len:227 (+),score=58.98 GHUV01037396.1:625-1305(+)
MSLFVAASAKLPGARNAEGQLLTDGFLDCCSLVCPVIGAVFLSARHWCALQGRPYRGFGAADQFGAAFALVKSDISGNIERLRARFLTHPQQFELLFSIIEEEMSRNDHTHGKSCTKGLLWLKRALEFMMAIMKHLLDDPSASMSDVVYAEYHAGLSKWHGFLASSAFNVAFNFVPSRETFMDKVAGGNDPEQNQQMRSFIDNFSPLLAQVHTFLDEKGLDDPAKV